MSKAEEASKAVGLLIVRQLPADKAAVMTYTSTLSHSPSLSVSLPPSLPPSLPLSLSLSLSLSLCLSLSLSLLLSRLLQHLDQGVGDGHARESLLASVGAGLRVATQACHQGQIQVELLHQPVLSESP